MPRFAKTIAFTGLLAASALVGAAGTKTDPTPDAAAALPLSAAPPAESAAVPLPPPDASSSSAAPSTMAPIADDADSGSETETAGPRPSAAPAKPVEPAKRPRYAIAVLQALDKVTAETIRFEAPIGKPIRYKTLIFTVHACETTAPDEVRTDAIAHVEIDSQPLPVPGHAAPGARQVFRGWMFASSPGLDLFQHPVYDAWLVACKTALPST